MEIILGSPIHGEYYYERLFFDPHHLKKETFRKNINMILIPRIVHQTYTSETLIPTCLASGYNAWKTFCTDENFTYMFWSDASLEALIRESYPQHLSLFLGFAYTIQRVDFARYCILHKYGGLYVDLNLEVKPGFLHLWRMYESKPVALGESDNSNTNFIGRKFTNALMMSLPECTLWPMIMKQAYDPFETWSMKGLLANIHHFEVSNSTGSGLVDETVLKYESMGNDIATLPKLLTAPGRSWYPKPYTTSDALIRVLPGVLWTNDSEQYVHYASRLLSNAFLVPSVLLIVLFLVIVRRR